MSKILSSRNAVTFCHFVQCVLPNASSLFVSVITVGKLFFPVNNHRELLEEKFDKKRTWKYGVVVRVGLMGHGKWDVGKAQRWHQKHMQQHTHKSTKSGRYDTQQLLLSSFHVSAFKGAFHRRSKWRAKSCAAAARLLLLKTMTPHKSSQAALLLCDGTSFFFYSPLEPCVFKMLLKAGSPLGAPFLKLHAWYSKLKTCQPIMNLWHGQKEQQPRQCHALKKRESELHSAFKWQSPKRQIGITLASDELFCSILISISKIFSLRWRFDYYQCMDLF